MKLVLLLLCLALPAFSASQKRHISPSGQVLLVKPKQGVDADEFHGRHGVRKVHGFKRTRWQVVRLPGNDEAAKRAVAAYLSSPLFDGVQENQTVTMQVTPSDPLFTQQWGPLRIEAPAAWDRINSAQGVIVAVCDTGVDFTHPDLAPNAWTAPTGEHGYQAQFGTIRTTTGDVHGHGTHVSGTIGAVGNNALGVAGLAWRVQIMDLKFLNESGSGQISDGMLMIEKAVDLKESGVNIRAINCSWGGGGPNQALQDAMQAAGDAGILMVCAAGNLASDVDIYPFTPASFPVDQILSVMATDETDTLATFSNFGWFGTDLAGPGVNILSTLPRTNYQAWSGTSMASPHVTGAAALLYAMNPNLTPRQVKQLLLSQASLDQRNLPSFTGGRLNLRKLVNNPEVFSPFNNHPPTLTVSGSNVTLNAGQSVRWTASATDTDGDAIIYRLQTAFDLDSIAVFKAIGGFRFSTGIASNDFTLTAVPWAHDDAARFTFHALDAHAGISSVNRSAFVFRSESVRTNLSQHIDSFTFRTNSDGWFEHALNLNVAPAGFQYAFQVDIGPNSWWTFGNKPDGSNTVYYLHRNAVTNAATARAFLFDNHGNVAASTSAVVRVVADAYVPKLRFTASTNRGVAPHTVSFNFSASNPENRPTSYSIKPWLGQSRISDAVPAVASLALTNPGTAAYELIVFDEADRTSDATMVLLTALPGTPPVPTNPPPVINLTAPTNLVLAITGRIMTIRWTDTATGEDRWEVQSAVKRRGPWPGFTHLTNLEANSTNNFMLGESKASYRFRVRASLLTTNGPWSNTVEGRVP